MTKFELELPSDVSDALVVAALREEADTVWHALNYLRKEEEPKDWELRDLWYNYRLLGAMYLVEEYLSTDPQIRKMYPREFEPQEEWMAWDD